MKVKEIRILENFFKSTISKGFKRRKNTKYSTSKKIFLSPRKFVKLQWHYWVEMQ